jgi:hypothetical protein
VWLGSLGAAAALLRRPVSQPLRPRPGRLIEGANEAVVTFVAQRSGPVEQRRALAGDSSPPCHRTDEAAVFLYGIVVRAPVELVRLAVAPRSAQSRSGDPGLVVFFDASSTTRFLFLTADLERPGGRSPRAVESWRGT